MILKGKEIEIHADISNINKVTNITNFDNDRRFQSFVCRVIIEIEFSQGNLRPLAKLREQMHKSEILEGRGVRTGISVSIIIAISIVNRDIRVVSLYEFKFGERQIYNLERININITTILIEFVIFNFSLIIRMYVSYTRKLDIFLMH